MLNSYDRQTFSRMCKWNDWIMDVNDSIVTLLLSEVIGTVANGFKSLSVCLSELAMCMPGNFVILNETWTTLKKNLTIIS